MERRLSIHHAKQADIEKVELVEQITGPSTADLLGDHPSEVMEAFFDVFARSIYCDHGNTIAVFGVNPICPGLCEAWAVVDKHAVEHGPELALMTRQLIGVAFRAGNLHRIHATVRADYPLSIRWLEAMRFRCEGRLRSYAAPGIDHLMYARIA